MSQLQCYSCFHPLEAESPFCPHCGQPTQTDQSKFPLALPCGTILSGRYVLGRVLGQGGFGITYVAQEYRSKELVAVKEFFPETMATRAGGSVTPYTGQLTDNFTYGKQCFLEEAETLAKFIGNPGIVRVHNYFEENGTAYFVMDYIQGVDLESHIKKKGGMLSWEETIKILYPVMDALSAVHAEGIIHRDVTPDNIYLTSSGEVKLLDFGAARYSLGDRSRSLDVVLKHGFAPKEQYSRRGRQGPYTDVYALGATLYYCLTGRLLPDSIDRMEDSDLVLPSSLGARLPAHAEDALDRALAVQPQDRFQSMAAFKAALEQPAPQEPPQPVPAAAGIPHSGGPAFAPQGAPPPGTGFAPQGGPAPGTGFVPPGGPPPGPGYAPQGGPAPGPGSSFTPPGGGPVPNGKMPQSKDLKPAGKSNRPKWLIPVIAGSGALILIVLLVVLLKPGTAPETSQRPSSPSLESPKPAEEPAEEPEEKSDAPGGPTGFPGSSGALKPPSGGLSVAGAAKYEHYYSSDYLFEIDYPEGFQAVEDEDGVYFLDPEDGFVIIVSVIGYTPDGEMVYDHNAFTEKIVNDDSALGDILGYTDYSIIDSGSTTLSGREAHQFTFSTLVDDAPSTGKFQVVDTGGSYGCYYLYSLMLDSGEAYREQLEAMERSFNITGVYQLPEPEPEEPEAPPSPVQNIDSHGMDNYMNSSCSGSIWAFAAMDITDGTIVGSATMNDQLSSSALLNIPILYACAALSDEGVISLDTTIRINRATAGRSVLAGRVGQSLPVYELLQYMLQYSDNTASNTLMENLTFKSINNTCAKYGYTSVSLNNYILSTTDYTANDNYVSCADLCGMLKELYSGRFSTIGSWFLLDNMVIQDSTARNGLGQSVPSGCAFMNLNGQKADKYNEVAIVDDGSRAYVVAFMGSRVPMEKLTAAARTCGKYVYGAIGLQ